MKRSREKGPRERFQDAKEELASDAPCAHKVAFRSEAHALRTMNNCQGMCEATNDTYFPVRAYSCPHCFLWHLTSKPLRPIPGQRS